jgi:prolyl oligopeptidase
MLASKFVCRGVSIRRIASVALASACLCIIVAAELARASQLPPPPMTHRDNAKDVMFGVTIPDPYRWLEDQTSPETRAWINEQDQYSRAILAKAPGREGIRRRLSELMKVESVTLPRERKGRFFFMKRGADEVLPSIYMREGRSGKDVMLVNPLPLSPDHSTSVTIRDVSRDGELLAYGVRKGGEDQTSVHLLDVDNRKDLTDVLPRADYSSVSLTLDKIGVYYGVYGPQGPRLYYHQIGSHSGNREIYGQGLNRRHYVFAQMGEDGQYLLITDSYGAGNTTDIYAKDLARGGPVFPVAVGLKAMSYGQLARNQVYLQTNWKAPLGRILRIDLRDPAQEHWRIVVPESSNVIDEFAVIGGKLFVSYLKDASSDLKVFDRDGHMVKEITFPALGTVEGLSGNLESKAAYYEYSSLFIPPTIYAYDIKTGGQQVWWRARVPVASHKFELQQVWYRSKDGTRVPMFLVHLKNLKRDGANPTLLTGYGGFDLNMTPIFNPVAVMWAEEGGVFALPNLRGGGEFGEKWHRAGMFGNKQNVFNDFLFAAQWLIQNHYTNPGKLAIRGASNGGLLVGAALTQRSDLFRAVVCEYPLLDMIRYQRFLDGPLWVSEYGSSENRAQFKYLLAYSPYQHVEKGVKYPAVLLVSGDGDTRVAPLHARKMTAMLQWATGSDRPILLLYDTKSGHSGGRPLNKEIDVLEDQFAFLFWQLGVHPTH